MIAMILTKNIKEYCSECKTAIKEIIEQDFSDFIKKPTLAVFQIGNNEASTRYIRNKKKDCEEVGINFEWYYYPEEITTNDLVQEIKDKLMANGALNAMMTGSGPTVFGLFDDKKKATAAVDSLKESRILEQLYLVKFVN